MTGSKSDAVARFECVMKELSAELGVPRWFVRHNMSISVSLVDGRGEVALMVDFGEVAGKRRFTDPEAAVRSVARWIAIADYDADKLLSDAKAAKASGAPDPWNELVNGFGRKKAEWMDELMEAAPQIEAR